MTTTESIRSFSGTHPYDVSVLQFMPTDYLQSIADQFRSPSITAEWLRESAIEMIDERIKDGRCPRCTRPLLDPENPTRMPAGSRITQCRSVPICGLCGSHESIEQTSCGLTPPELWRLLTPLKVRRRVNKWDRDHSAPISGYTDGNTVITEAAVTTPHPRPNPGGWAEFGGIAELPEETK